MERQASELFPLSPSVEKRFRLLFQELLRHSEFGYVLFGEKPIILDGLPLHCNGVPGTKQHRTATTFSEGIRLWQQMPTQALQSHLYLHVYPQRDVFAPSFRHFVVIHENALQKEVKKNFQTIQALTAFPGSPEEFIKQQVLQKPTFSDATFCDFRVGGILLGYGATDSLVVGKNDQLRNFCLNRRWKVPYTYRIEEINNLYPLPGLYSFLLHALAVNEYFPHEKENALLLFKEVRELAATITLPKRPLTTQEPILLIGTIAGNQEGVEQYEKYEKCQKKIQTLLNSPDWFQIVLLHLFQPWHTPLIFREPDMQIGKTKLFAKELLLHIEKQFAFLDMPCTNYFPSLVKGLAAAEKKEAPPHDPILDQFSEIAWKQRAWNNWQTSERWVQQRKQEKKWQMKEPSILYYIVKEGMGMGMQTLGKRIKLTCSSYFPSGTNESTLDKPTWIQVEHLFPGFAKGIMGMKKGEIRELLIHPSAGYPLLSPVEPFIGRCIVVELHDFSAEPWGEELSSSPIRVEEAQNFENVFLGNLLAFDEAYQFWTHLREIDGVTFADFLQEVASLSQKEPIMWALSEEEAAALHWHHLQHYFSINLNNGFFS